MPITEICNLKSHNIMRVTLINICVILINICVILINIFENLRNKFVIKNELVYVTSVLVIH
jgi:hypothetical protein